MFSLQSGPYYFTFMLIKLATCVHRASFGVWDSETQATLGACRRRETRAPRSQSPPALSLPLIPSSPEAFSSTPKLATHKLMFHVSSKLVLLLKISMRVFNQHHKLMYQTLYSPTGNWLLPCLSLLTKLSPAPSCASLKH